LEYGERVSRLPISVKKHQETSYLGKGGGEKKKKEIFAGLLQPTKRRGTFRLRPKDISKKREEGGEERHRSAEKREKVNNTKTKKRKYEEKRRKKRGKAIKRTTPAPDDRTGEEKEKGST